MVQHYPPQSPWGINWPVTITRCLWRNLTPRGCWRNESSEQASTSNSVSFLSHKRKRSSQISPKCSQIERSRFLSRDAQLRSVKIKLSHFGIRFHYQIWIEVSLGISISTLIIFALKGSVDFCLSCEVKRPGGFPPLPKLVTDNTSPFRVGCEIFLTWHLWPSEYFWKFSRRTSLSPQRLSIILPKGCWAWYWLEGRMVRRTTTLPTMVC